MDTAMCIHKLWGEMSNQMRPEAGMKFNLDITRPRTLLLTKLGLCWLSYYQTTSGADIQLDDQMLT